MFMRRDTKRLGGFTIVELLIVIVVIAILATITIVTFNGIQQRATTAAITSAVDQWEKLVRMEMITSGGLPDGLTCLGRSVDDFPAESGGLGAGVCMSSTNGTQAGFDSDFMSQWATYDSLPSGLLPVTTAKNGSMAVRSRGIMLTSYAAVGGDVVRLVWVPQKAGECGRGESSLPDNGLAGDQCILYIE